VTTALCPLGRIVADCRWHSKLQNKAQETKFLTLSCVKSLLREKAPSWTAHSWIGQPSIFIPIFCNAFTRPPEKWPSRRGSARIRPAEEKAKST
jgi:hypothetical protein